MDEDQQLTGYFDWEGIATHLGWPFTKKNDQCLEYSVRESWTNGYPFCCEVDGSESFSSRLKPRKDCRLTENSFDTVNHNDTQRTLVAISKHFIQVCDLLSLRESDHVLCRNELDEGEL